VIQGPVRQNAILSIAAARQSPVLITVSAENSVIISSSFNLLHPAVSYLSVITTSEEDLIMKKAAGVGALVLMLAFAALATAQPWQGWKSCGGWCRESGGGPGGPGGGPGRIYDPAKAEIVKGEVTAVEKVGAGRRMGPGIGLKLTTASGEVAVHLGPQWYIEQQGDIPIKAGDSVEVKGVKASRDGKDFFIAGEVKKGADVLKLRDENGVPLWAGWRKGNS